MLTKPTAPSGYTTQSERNLNQVFDDLTKAGHTTQYTPDGKRWKASSHILHEDATAELDHVECYPGQDEVTRVFKITSSCGNLKGYHYCQR